MLAAIEARAILGVGQEVIDDLGRVGVDPVGAGAGEDAENLEVVVADRGGVAEIVARAPDVGGALIGESVVRVERGEIGPDDLRRRAVEIAEAEAEERLDRLVLVDPANGVDRPFAEPR